MAANFIPFDRNTDVGRQIAAGLQKVREGRDQLVTARDIIIQMRDGDGSDATHYDLVATELGYEAGDYATAAAAAKASFDELDSLLSKINTDNAVSAVLAATNQACAKHGIPR